MSESKSINLVLSFDTLRDAVGQVGDFAKRNGASAEAWEDVELAVEELLVNVIEHGYKGKGGDVELGLEASGDLLTLRIIDQALAFDPTQALEPDLDVPLEEREKGGMGIHLVKNLMDAIRYQRDGNRNVLTLEKRCLKDA